jgi:hypothetical protein
MQGSEASGGLVKKTTSVIFVAFVTLTVLVGCVRYEGNVNVNSSGLLSGRLVFALDKSLAALTGINSLSDLRNQQQQQTGNSGCDASGLTYSETATEYIAECRFTNRSDLGEDLGSRVDGDSILFFYRQIQDASDNELFPEGFGSVRIEVEFPAPISNINQAGAGQVVRLGERGIRITGKVSDTINVEVTSICPAACRSQPSKPEGDGVDGSQFTPAPKTFGGRVTRNLVFRGSKEPYIITKTIEIPEGKSVRIEPSATLIWRQEGRYRPMFDNHGTLIVQGTRQKPVVFTGRGRNTITYFNTNASFPNSRTVVRFAEFIGGSRLSYHRGNGQGALETQLQISDSVIRALREPWQINTGEGHLRLERNTFINSAGLQINVFVTRNKNAPTVDVVGHRVIQDKRAMREIGQKAWLQVNDSQRGKSGVLVKVNQNDFSKAEGVVLRINPETTLDARGNYWGTVDPSRIRMQVRDGESAFPVHSGVIDIGDPLSSPPAGLPPRVRTSLTATVR